MRSRSRCRVASLAGLALALAGACSSGPKPGATATPTAGPTTALAPGTTAPPATTAAVSGSTAAAPVAGAETEDNRPPPGAVNPDVTQANIGSTICAPGWTATVRPPAAYTRALKRRQIAARHLRDTAPGDYEEDHAIALELGGAPADPDNLWPEPIAAAQRADRVERRLRDRVCARTMSLAAAQAAILEYKRGSG